jgi:hypothetical protein
VNGLTRPVKSVAVAVGLVASILVGCGDRGEAVSSRFAAARVRPHEQRALPTEQLTLGSELCPEEAEARRLPSAEVRRRQRHGRRQFAALEAAYRRHPDALVRTTYLSSDEGPGTEDITVRELARSHLRGSTGVSGGGIVTAVARSATPFRELDGFNYADRNVPCTRRYVAQWRFGDFKPQPAAGEQHVYGWVARFKSPAADEKRGPCVP